MTRDDIIRKVREDDLQRAYERGYRAGIAAEREACAALLVAEREAIIQMMPGGHSVDPQWVCDAIRARTP